MMAAQLCMASDKLWRDLTICEVRKIRYYVVSASGKAITVRSAQFVQTSFLLLSISSHEGLGVLGTLGGMSLVDKV